MTTVQSLGFTNYNGLFINGICHLGGTGYTLTYSLGSVKSQNSDYVINITGNNPLLNNLYNITVYNGAGPTFPPNIGSGGTYPFAFDSPFVTVPQNQWAIFPIVANGDSSGQLPSCLFMANGLGQAITPSTFLLPGYDQFAIVDLVVCLSNPDGFRIADQIHTGTSNYRKVFVAIGQMIATGLNDTTLSAIPIYNSGVPFVFGLTTELYCQAQYTAATAGNSVYISQYSVNPAASFTSYIWPVQYVSATTTQQMFNFALPYGQAERGAPGMYYQVTEDTDSLNVGIYGFEYSIPALLDLVYYYL